MQGNSQISLDNPSMNSNKEKLIESVHEISESLALKSQDIDTENKALIA